MKIQLNIVLAYYFSNFSIKQGTKASNKTKKKQKSDSTKEINNKTCINNNKKLYPDFWCQYSLNC